VLAVIAATLLLLLSSFVHFVGLGAAQLPFKTTWAAANGNTASCHHCKTKQLWWERGNAILKQAGRIGAYVAAVHYWLRAGDELLVGIH